MNEIAVEVLSETELEDPILIEGLPGVGLVGKLAVDQLINELASEAIRRIYSEHLPPAVSIDGDGTASLASMTLHAVETDAVDLLVLTGDSQAQETIGQYRLANAVLDLAEEFGVHDVITLGGFGTGEQVDDYTVVGAVGDASSDLKERLDQAGVSFDDESDLDTIIGMSGVLVGMAPQRDIQSAGLLGITPGYYVDPASARVVLNVLQDSLAFDVDLTTLDEQAEQVQELLEQHQQQSQQDQPGQTGENLRYFE